MIDNYLATTCREMGVAMMRTAYSPMFNESLDFSCVMFDKHGRMIAQAEFCPSQIGTIKFTVEWMIDELGTDVYKPGDVIIMNDPYRGSGHIPEHTLLKAVFHEGEIVAFVANCAHLAEPGAKAPGGLVRRRHRHLPGRPTPAAAVAPARGQGSGGRVEDHLRQPPHAEGHLRRPDGDGRLVERGRAPADEPHRDVRPRHVLLGDR